MMDGDSLRLRLSRIDGKSYPAYKDIAGAYGLGGCSLHIDRVQGDPFAAPSKVRLRVAAERSGIPPNLFNSRPRRVACEDFLARQVAACIGSLESRVHGSGKSGYIGIDAGAQQVLERTAVCIGDGWVEARLYVGLPAAGRRVLARQAQLILCEQLPQIAEAGLCARSMDLETMRRFVDCVDNHDGIREQLDDLGLVAFVADGSVLPRRSGACDQPLGKDVAVPTLCPETLRVHVCLRRPIDGPAGQQLHSLTGLGIPKGVTLVVGGGYHGKSTLLRALERGVYPHVPGDGREWVVTTEHAVKVRAEDGRRIETVDISPFISNLPLGRDTRQFCTDDASGSTSQAASILEAVECGARLLLLDEDTSATNFLVRDARMQALVHTANEPITPLVDRVRELYETLGVSTLLVMGGCGDYFDVADTVLMLREYQLTDVTSEAREVARGTPTGRRTETAAPMVRPPARAPRPDSFDASGPRGGVKIEARAVDTLQYGAETIDLRGVEQVVDASQTRAIGQAIYYASRRLMGDGVSVRQVVESLEAAFDASGLDLLSVGGRPGQHPGSLARPRKYELAAAINRLRSVKMRAT